MAECQGTRKGWPESPVRAGEKVTQGFDEERTKAESKIGKEEGQTGVHQRSIQVCKRPVL